MKAAAPLVSVILPVYQAEATVEAAARSILNGAFADLELVVVDDGSTDGSAERVAALARGDERVRLLRREHGGVAAAANAAVAAARAPLIARMDADDMAHPERLARQVDLLERAGLDVVGSQVRVVGPGGEDVPSMERYARWINELTEHDDIVAQRFVEQPLVHPTVLGTRAAFELGFRSAERGDGAFPEDYDWFLRAAAQGLRFGKVPAPLLHWTESPDRLTRRDPAYAPEAFDRCRRAHLRAGPLASVDEVDLWGVGRTGRPWLRWLVSEGMRVRVAYDVDPRKVGGEVLGCPVRHPDDLSSASGVPMVIAVGAAGARELITPALRARGYRIGVDAWFVA
jgi:hypothetical protein